MAEPARILDSNVFIGGEENTVNSVTVGKATDKVALRGGTPVVLPAAAEQAAPVAYVTGALGLDSDANMEALYDLVVAMRTAMVDQGLMKGSA